VGVHLLEFLRIFEAGRAAIGGILAFEIEVAATQTWSLSIAFDFPSFAFIAGGLLDLQVQFADPIRTLRYNESETRRNLRTMKTAATYHAIEIYLFLFARVCVTAGVPPALGLPFASSDFLFFVPFSLGPPGLPSAFKLAMLECRSPFMMIPEMAMGDSAR
jgi:hypothetical protein